ncbi:autoinducer binding domain-containing protein [Novosphingobium sp. PhB165]|uniref:helix-turn-helix transcriptional regulator n=1 Tax=Novosphingobium sp. PhB165 TaxID=2485105 RepID=UPI001404B060|nr:autoinducer binding domain-containing protein [Novosphingobium sp. PhB165]
MTRFWRLIGMATTMDDLALVLADVTVCLGFQRYALTHHSDPLRTGGRLMRLHNYPPQWVDYYDQHGLGPSDPVHRASYVTSSGFPWQKIPRLIGLNREDYSVMERARQQGISDGFTIPICVPGEAHGSVTFVGPGASFARQEMLFLAELFGGWAFEKARVLTLGRGIVVPDSPLLTNAQRQCTVLAAAGKNDGEIGTIIGISKLTAGLHLRQACERYDVSKRTLLVVRALFDGTVNFSEIFRR